MKKAILVLVVLALVLSMTGCAVNFTASNGKLSYGAVSGKAGDEFKASKRITYFIHPQLLQFGEKTQEKLETIIDPEIAKAGGKGATNLKITYNFDFLAFLVQYILPIGFPLIQVSGQVVK